MASEGDPRKSVSANTVLAIKEAAAKRASSSKKSIADPGPLDQNAIPSVVPEHIDIPPAPKSADLIVPGSGSKSQSNALEEEPSGGASAGPASSSAPKSSSKLAPSQAAVNINSGSGKSTAKSDAGGAAPLSGGGGPGSTVPGGSTAAEPNTAAEGSGPKSSSATPIEPSNGGAGGPGSIGAGGGLSGEGPKSTGGSALGSAAAEGSGGAAGSGAGTEPSGAAGSQKSAVKSEMSSAKSGGPKSTGSSVGGGGGSDANVGSTGEAQNNKSSMATGLGKVSNLNASSNMGGAEGEAVASKRSDIGKSTTGGPNSATGAPKSATGTPKSATATPKSDTGVAARSATKASQAPLSAKGAANEMGNATHRHRRTEFAEAASEHAGGKNKKMTRYRYHKRITVRTTGKGSGKSAAILKKVNNQEGPVTPSTIDQLDPEVIMARAGIKGNKNARWRVRMRQTKRTTKNGKTITQTKVAYRDSDGKKQVKLTNDPTCKKCNHKIEQCKCDSLSGISSVVASSIKSSPSSPKAASSASPKPENSASPKASSATSDNSQKSEN